jgi:flagellin
MLSILSNPASLAAENQLGITNTSLQNTLLQLSSGLRINSGADDPAGLAIANGLQANISALTQSASNANDGVGELQVADGALAQVTTLLNQAVTLATESANGTVSDSQRVAIQAEYSSILSEINRIGTNTTYNSSQVFANVGDATSAATNLASTTTLGGKGGYATSADGTLTLNSPLLSTGSPAGLTLTINGNTVYTAGASDTMQNLVNAVNATGQFTASVGTGKLVITAIGNTTAPTVAGTLTTNDNTVLGDFTGTAGTSTGFSIAANDGSGRQVTISDNGGLTAQQLITDIDNSQQGFAAQLSNGSLVVTDMDSADSPTISGTMTSGTGVLGAFTTSTGPALTSIYLSDSTSAGSSAITVGIGAISSSSIADGNGANAVDLANTTLSSQGAAETALGSINEAIQNVASMRGSLGASINRLQSAQNVINAQVQNLTAAENNITAADIPSTVANLTQYSILEQTGVAALSQANQMQQLVLKLLQ